MKFSIRDLLLVTVICLFACGDAVTCWWLADEWLLESDSISRILQVVFAAIAGISIAYFLLLLMKVRRASKTAAHSLAPAPYPLKE